MDVPKEEDMQSQHSQRSYHSYVSLAEEEINTLPLDEDADEVGNRAARSPSMNARRRAVHKPKDLEEKHQAQNEMFGFMPFPQVCTLLQYLNGSSSSFLITSVLKKWRGNNASPFLLVSVQKNMRLNEFVVWSTKLSSVVYSR